MHRLQHKHKWRERREREGDGGFWGFGGFTNWKINGLADCAGRIMKEVIEGEKRGQPLRWLFTYKSSWGRRLVSRCRGRGTLWSRTDGGPRLNFVVGGGFLVLVG